MQLVKVAPRCNYHQQESATALSPPIGAQLNTVFYRIDSLEKTFVEYREQSIFYKVTVKSEWKQKIKIAMQKDGQKEYNKELDYK